MLIKTNILSYAIAEIFLAKPRPLPDLLQKAVGWLLREAGKRDEERLVAWLRANWTSMPCTMRRYAVERRGLLEKEEQEAIDALDRKLTDGAFQLNLF